MLKTIAYLLNKRYDFRVGSGKYIIIFDDIITFDNDVIVVRDRNLYFSFSTEEFHESVNNIIETIKDNTFTEEYAAHEGTKCPICGKIYTNTTWHDYVNIFNTLEVLGSICDNCATKISVIDTYKKVGGVLKEDFDCAMTKRLRNYEIIKSQLQED